jgi:ABC-type uncharacterized transport system substrate-binding protein
MKLSRFIQTTVTILVLALIGITLLGYVENGKKASSREENLLPQKKGDNKFKVGYIENIPFVNYPSTFYYILKSLEEMNWLEDIGEIPFEYGQTDTKSMWNYLSSQNKSEYLEFLPDFHYSLPSMDDDQIERLMARLKTEEIDMVIVLGTVAAKMVANVETDIHFMVFSVSDAVVAGISETYELSGQDNFWVHTDPERFERQLTIFYDLFNYKKIGIVMEDSWNVRAYTPIKELEKLSKAFGFEIRIQYVDEPKHAGDFERYRQELKNAYQELSKEVDSLYITVANIDADWLKELLQPFYDKKIPVFSQLGGQEVSKGALMSINVSSFKEIGQFGARRMVQVLKGKKPGQLSQRFVSTPQIDINIGVADLIGYPVSFDMLLVADKIYLEIE